MSAAASNAAEISDSSNECGSQSVTVALATAVTDKGQALGRLVLPS